jgi:DNA mismatch endonuclease, patch repair protein
MTLSAPASISERIRRIRKTDTKPELAVRRAAHALNYRFRLHRRDLPGTPDLVFPSRRKVILVHGCFWHQHDCPLGGKQPSTNQHYWLPKLARNVARDVAVRKKLGGAVLVIWECETQDAAKVGRKLRDFLR